MPPRTLLLLFLSALAATSAAAPSPDAIPNPLHDPAACHRPAPSWICDTAGYLSAAGGDELEGVLRDVAAARRPYAAAPCAPAGGRTTRGHQVAVALVPAMKLKRGEEAGEGAERYARALMDGWGVGEAGCNDGVVVFVSVADRQTYILAGRGAAASLPPKSATRVAAAMAPRLRAGDVDAALKGAAIDVGLCLAGAPPPGAAGGFDWGLILFLAIFAFIALSAARAALARRRQLAGARAALDRLRTEQAAAEESAAYPAASCPVCLEEFDGGGTAEPSAPPLGDDDCGAGGEAAAALLPAAPPATKLRPLALPCGHTFCEPCIRRWLARSDTCPICRAAVGAGAAPPAGAAAAAAGAPPAAASRPYSPSAYRDELVFRLGSLSRLYPAVVTAEVLHGLVSSARSGAPLPVWADVRAAEMTDARTAARRRYEGAHGARAAFGGGTAVGASGGGSSW